MVKFEIDSPRATLTLDDPERRNPISTEVMAELTEGVKRAAADDRVRVLVFTGAGDRVFSAGGDLSSGFVDRPAELHEARGALGDLFREMRGCGKPTVARVNGHALAGGFGLATACDIVVAVDYARFGTPEVNVGLWPMMITAVLQRVVPHKALLELMLTGRQISAEEARDLGVVSRVVTVEELDPVVDEIVEALASKSPTVLRLGKDAFYQVEDMDFDAALEYLQNAFTTLAMTDDAREGVRAFLEKRDPDWK